ncbi:ABC transporter substrate-binding protein [Actinomadura sp. DC4]|uniref:ABC transporter substrate-binding protein n=1 Tax=Actinomadura sp. DC4 TaxID=3055069 RepID=UPI0025B1A15A|nr:ABC transporter substrate-binding protein [Actinomadura sp. DC4]MDN3359395.1 ABC transporter substrate-binding protein [Actinomadura sp. DC4]
MARIRMPWSAARRSAAACVAVVSAVALAGCGSDKSGGDAGSGLAQSGTLTVGMNLQFKPEMYLDAANKPAGYDVDLLNKLAADLGVKLVIKNLDFNGLIPGLQAKKFDLVSVGLTATEERKQVIDFTRAYVPYTSVLAVKQNDSSPATIPTYDVKGKTITALQGSTGEQLAKKSFPSAKLQTYSDQNAALLQVATGRANGSVLEDYILAQYQKSNPNQLKKAALPKPLDLSYGSWAVQKGNKTLTDKLNTFLCKAQTDGSLATLYKKDFGVTDAPAMPAGC